MTYTRDQLTDFLREGVCAVTFTKVNGEQRVMPCTLNSEIIPPIDVKELREEKTRKVNLDNLSVWCTDKNEWRSFKIANVIEVTPVE